MPEVLITGGAGYIGTHIICALATSNRTSISIDNYSNSSPKAILRVLSISPGSVEAFNADIRDTTAVRKILNGRNIHSVIHLAGLKSVGESTQFPERYYENNVKGTRMLLDALDDSPVRNFVFSSSATVYGAAAAVPYREDAPTGPSNPYGENKLAIEKMLAAVARNDPSWRIVNLRYFNPVGAHESGFIGEDPKGIPNNLMPLICHVATGRRDRLDIFGDDYPTHDGTGVRDYIHVMDLAEGHVAALDALAGAGPGTVMTVNLGTGRPCSVLELVTTFERVNNVKVARRVVQRRPGDIAEYYADPTRAFHLLGWKARRGIEEMCRDAWRWQEMNPNGYR